MGDDRPGHDLLASAYSQFTSPDTYRLSTVALRRVGRCELAMRKSDSSRWSRRSRASTSLVATASPIRRRWPPTVAATRGGGGGGGGFRVVVVVVLPAASRRRRTRSDGRKDREAGGGVGRRRSYDRRRRCSRAALGTRLDNSRRSTPCPRSRRLPDDA